MPLAEWPEVDNRAWREAIRDGGLLDDRGLAVHWRPETRRSVIAAYGRYLTSLDRIAGLDRAEGPATRLTPDRLRAYIDELKTQVAPATVSGRNNGIPDATPPRASPEGSFAP